MKTKRELLDALTVIRRVWHVAGPSLSRLHARVTVSGIGASAAQQRRRPRDARLRGGVIHADARRCRGLRARRLLSTARGAHSACLHRAHPMTVGPPKIFCSPAGSVRSTAGSMRARTSYFNRLSPRHNVTTLGPREVLLLTPTRASCLALSLALMCTFDTIAPPHPS